MYRINECVEKIDLGDGVTRKILSYGGNIMLAEFEFQEGVGGETHTHPHEQIGYVVEGTIEFNLNGEKKLLHAGDSMYIAPNLPHGAKAITAAKTIDVFSPIRDEYVD